MKRQTIQQIWAKICTDISQRKTNEWPIMLWKKMLNIISHQGNVNQNCMIYYCTPIWMAKIKMTAPLLMMMWNWDSQMLLIGLWKGTIGLESSGSFSIKLNRHLGFPGATAVKNLPAMQETRALSLGREDPLQDGMATHSSILAWRIPMDWGA